MKDAESGGMEAGQALEALRKHWRAHGLTEVQGARTEILRHWSPEQIMDLIRGIAPDSLRAALREHRR